MIPFQSLAFARSVSVALTMLSLLGIATDSLAADLNDLTWTTENDQVTITDCDQNAAGTLEIPPLIEGNPVTTIASDAFSHCALLSDVVLPEGVTSIGDNSFVNCLSLRTVSLPESLQSIGVWAFGRCESLKAASIPAGVTSIGFVAFASCISLPTIEVAPSNMHFQSIDGVLFNSTGTLLLTVPAGRSGRYSIPASVTGIESAAFRDCKNIHQVVIHEDVNFIGANSFEGCNSLSRIITASPNMHFQSLDGVLFDADASTLITYPAGKTGIYTVPTTVGTIAELAFAQSHGLTGVTIGDNVTTIGNLAFYQCRNLESAWVGNGVTTIGDLTFQECESLRTLRLGTNISEIGSQTFLLCKSLSRVSLPRSLVSIGNRAFALCYGLTTVIIEGAPPTMGDIVFEQIGAGAIAEVEPDQLAAFGGAGADWNGLQVAMADTAAMAPLTTDFGRITGAKIVNTGDSVTLTASPQPGFAFAHWTGDANGTDNPLSVTLDSDLAVGAVFVPEATYNAIAASGREEVINDPQAFELFTADQLQALATGMTISRKPDGTFTLIFDVKKSSDLVEFIDIDNTGNTVHINAEGNIELDFVSGERAEFFRLLFRE
jgi:hypothetical protein